MFMGRQHNHELIVLVNYVTIPGSNTTYHLHKLSAIFFINNNYKLSSQNQIKWRQMTTSMVGSVHKAPIYNYMVVFTILMVVWCYVMEAYQICVRWNMCFKQLSKRNENKSACTLFTQIKCLFMLSSQNPSVIIILKSSPCLNGNAQILMTCTHNCTINVMTYRV